MQAISEVQGWPPPARVTPAHAPRSPPPRVTPAHAPRSPPARVTPAHAPRSPQRCREPRAAPAAKPAPRSLGRTILVALRRAPAPTRCSARQCRPQVDFQITMIMPTFVGESRAWCSLACSRRARCGYQWPELAKVYAVCGLSSTRTARAFVFVFARTRLFSRAHGGKLTSFADPRIPGIPGYGAGYPYKYGITRRGDCFCMRRPLACTGPPWRAAPRSVQHRKASGRCSLS